MLHSPGIHQGYKYLHTYPRNCVFMCALSEFVSHFSYFYPTTCATTFNLIEGSLAAAQFHPTCINGTGTLPFITGFGTLVYARVPNFTPKHGILWLVGKRPPSAHLFREVEAIKPAIPIVGVIDIIRFPLET